MGTAKKPPVAFRLPRPYATEDDFVAGDGPAFFKGGMVLVGARSRPDGLIVRFEVALQDGSPLFRGEGRVVTHRREPEEDRPAGLEVRFTRLDARGKDVVERIRQARRRGEYSEQRMPAPASSQRRPSQPGQSGPHSEPLSSQRKNIPLDRTAAVPAIAEPAPSSEPAPISVEPASSQERIEAAANAQIPADVASGEHSPAPPDADDGETQVMPPVQDTPPPPSEKPTMEVAEAPEAAADAAEAPASESAPEEISEAEADGEEADAASASVPPSEAPDSAAAAEAPSKPAPMAARSGPGLAKGGADALTRLRKIAASYELAGDRDALLGRLREASSRQA